MIEAKTGERSAANGMLATLSRVGAGALIPITTFCMALALWYNITGDGRRRFDDLDALLRRGILTNGRYSLIGPLFSTPLYLLGGAFGYPEGGAVFYNLLLFIIALIALRALLRDHLEPATLRRFLLLLIAGSLFPAAIATYYGETFTAVTMGVGMVAALLARRRWARWTGWAAVALGAANLPAALPGLGLALLARIWTTRRWRYALPGVAAIALVVSESLIRRGSPFASMYLGNAGDRTIMPYSGLPGFSFPFVFGVLAILFSFGKGLVYYLPGLFLPLRRQLDALGTRAASLWGPYSSWLLFVAGLVLIYASWWAWDGALFFGPRYFLIASLPASLALALWASRPSPRLWVNLIILALLTLTSWVGVDGTVFGLADLQVCQINHGQYYALCDYSLEFSALWRPFENLAHYGLTATFARVEYFQSRAAPILIMAPVVWLYVSAPLLRAITTQTRASLGVWALAVRARLAALRF